MLTMTCCHSWVKKMAALSSELFTHGTGQIPIDDLCLNRFRALKPLPILITSNFVPKTGFQLQRRYLLIVSGAFMLKCCVEHTLSRVR